MAGATELRAQSLDERVLTGLARGPGTGAIIAIVHADSLLLLQAFGQQSEEDERPMGLDDLFHMGSMGEVFLGAVAVQAALQGHVRLDAPISEYTSDLPDGIGQATMAQLLTSTAGLDDSPLLGRLQGEELEDLPPERELELLSDRVVLTAPGMVRSRSRYNLLVAGHALESALGRPLPELFREFLGEPAGMLQTVFSSDAAGLRSRVQGYTRSTDASGPFQTADRPDDALLAPYLRAWSSAPDLARLLGAWLGSLDADDAAERDPHPLAIASLPAVGDNGSPGNPLEFGFGWRVGSGEGDATDLSATGGGSGHSVLLRVVPEARLGIVIVTNGAGTSLFGVSAFILERLVPDLLPDPAGVEPAYPRIPELFPSPVVPPPLPVERPGPEHVGTYRNGSEIFVLVETEEGLGAELGTGAPLEVRSHGGGVLTAHIADGREAMRMRLVQDREGGVYLILRGRAFRQERE